MQLLAKRLLGSASLAAALLFGATGSAAAQGQLSDQDRTQPIEIEADLLTLEQDRSRAIFEGHVLAVQGEVSLKAARVLVYYVADGGESEQSIRLIEAFGDVVIASPRETATGAEGIYDVAGETMTLTGDVVLTRDENVLKGDRLDIDLASNIHRLSSDAEGQGRRVRALFQPAAQKESP